MPNSPVFDYMQKMGGDFTLRSLQNLVGRSPVVEVYEGPEPKGCTVDPKGELLGYVTPDGKLVRIKQKGTPTYIRMRKGLGWPCELQCSVSLPGLGGDIEMSEDRIVRGHPVIIKLIKRHEA